MAKKATPLMQQYNRVKADYPEALLLFRVGDFYETFGDDAVKAADVLDIVLTKRGNGSASEVELAGFPHHSLDTYLPRLVRAGHRVAVCDQLEDPKKAVGIVKRGVTELVTPGVAFHDQVLNARTDNYLAAVHGDKTGYGLALLDISTGDFATAEGNEALIDRLLRAHQPAEVLVLKNQATAFAERFGSDWHLSRLDDWVFKPDYAQERIQKQFENKSLKGFQLDARPLALLTAGAILHYLDHAKHDRPKHVRTIRTLREDGTLWMDRFTIRNLELVRPNHNDGTSLAQTIDRTGSPMGARMLRRWLIMPLTDVGGINQRLDAVECLNGDEDLRTGFQALFKSTGDLERLASKASTGRINPRELGQLRQGLEAVQSIAALSAGEAPLLPYLERLTPCDQLLERLRSELVEEPPVNPAKGQVIEQGVSAELDELRTLKSNAQAALDAICARETERTGISSLKIAYNQVFGYYLEVRNTHKDKVPAEWIRKQTLTQAERYITEELKELEAKILDAQERTASLELACFHNLVQGAAEHIGNLQQNAHVIGALDALTGLAQVAIDNNYVRPRLNDSQGIQIKNGRHPVIERALKPGEPFIANDVALHPDSNQILMITGPNMAGKSALLRQTALICLMAQMGGYVPAASADLGILDRIFTRVGASDNISSGESTFMVEMNETAAILNNLTPRSLVLLDEIGRGTSTYDGVSIAWSIAEYLHEHPHKALTLFATHYHELNAMQERFHRVVNLNVTVREVDGKIIFLRKLAQGGSNHSFGINVAQLAGMPTPILRRAKEVLKQLESSRKQLDNESTPAPPVPDVSMASDVQLSFFQLDDPVLEQVREQILDLDIDNLTPVEALMKLNEIKKVVSGSATAKSERP